MDIQQDIIQSEDLSDKSGILEPHHSIPDLHELLKRLPDIIFCVDRECHVHYVNHAEFDLDDHHPEKTTIYDLMPPGFSVQLKQALQDTFETNRIQQFEYLSGAGQWWNVSAQAISSAEFTGFALIVLSEITLQKQEIHILQALEQAFTYLSFDIDITDTEGRLIFTNQECNQKNIGLIPELLRTSEHGTDEYQASVWPTIETGKIWTDVVQIPDASGDEKAHEVTILPFTNSRNEITNYILIKTEVDGGILPEITETQEQEFNGGIQDNPEMTDLPGGEEEETGTSLIGAGQPDMNDFMLHSIHHEMSGPLKRMHDAVGQMLKRDIRSDVKRDLIDLQNSSEHLHRLTQNIHDLIQIQSGQFTFESTVAKLRELFMEPARQASAPAFEKGLELIVDPDPDLPVNIYADGKRIRQMITGLLTHAIQRTKSGTVTLRIRGDMQEAGSMRLCFSVTDTGDMVTAGFQEAFARNLNGAPVPAFNQQSYAGPVLGLVLCAWMAEKMQGHLEIESPVSPHMDTGDPALAVPGSGTGCTIHLVLNVQVPEQAHAGPLNLHEKYRGRPVLIVAENLSLRMSIEKALTRFGLHPIGVSGDRAALAALNQLMLQNTPAALVLIDSSLRGMGAFKLAEQIIHDDGLNPDIIMMHSPLIPEEEIAKYRTIGITVHPVKPLDPSDLIDLFAGDISDPAEQTGTAPDGPDDIPSEIEHEDAELSDFHLDAAHEPAMDMDRAMQTFGGDSVTMMEHIHTFINTFPETVRTFHDHVHNGQMTFLEKSAREFKIRARMLGAGELYLWADRLETAGWKMKTADAPFILENLSKAFDRLRMFADRLQLSKQEMSASGVRRILLIEENADHQQFLKTRLQEFGNEILLAEDGFKGLEMARKEKPDLIILDLMLPHISGHGVAHMLRLDPECRHIPLIMLTCRDMKEDNEMAIRGGIDLFMLKSTETDKLIEEINRLVPREQD
ncbi:response regulator [bacterium]|nr:response regulator [bacterium]